MRSSIYVTLSLLCLCVDPASVWAAGGEGADWGWIETIGRWFNLLVLFGVLAYFLRQPMKKFFQGRRKEIQDELREANLAREEAERRRAQMEERLSRLDEELEELRQEAETAAQQDRARILEQAVEDRKKILTGAQREIEGLARAARQDLQEFAGQLAVDLAARKIESEMDETAQERLAERVVVKLGEDRKRG